MMEIQQMKLMNNLPNDLQANYSKFRITQQTGIS